MTTPTPTSVACPRCGARPGRRCHTGDGHHAQPTHAARKQAAQETTTDAR